MALDKRSLLRLRKRLPHEYIKDAQARLAEQGRELPASYISQIIGGNRYDKEVILVLIKMADEYQADQKRIAEQARGLHLITK